MILGTDVNLDTCKEEGYLMVEFDENIEFNKDTEYYLFSYYGYQIPSSFDKLYVDCSYSFNQLVELYNKNKDSINSCCDTESNVNFINPTIYDLLNLANDVECYQGL